MTVQTNFAFKRIFGTEKYRGYWDFNMAPTCVVLLSGQNIACGDYFAKVYRGHTSLYAHGGAVRGA